MTAELSARVCRHGHVGRYTLFPSGGAKCLECCRLRSNAQYAAAPEHRRAVIEKSRSKYVSERRASARAYMRKRRQNNEFRRADVDRTLARKREHPGIYAAIQGKRRAAQLRRTPAWANLRKIEQVYAEAAWMTVLMGEPWHVNHVIPLQGRLVSGLHVHNNLQILPGAENARKGNRSIPS